MQWLHYVHPEHNSGQQETTAHRLTAPRIAAGTSGNRHGIGMGHAIAICKPLWQLMIEQFCMLILNH